ncbi:MAG: endolytic transglycosylase MltG [Muribaculaceae bacterium]|nr:endolytic transglycosylase MltG [Muribaculaceae bacterium]
MEDKKETIKNGDAKRFGAGATRRRVLTVVMLVVMAWGAWYFTRMAAGFDGDKAVWVRIPATATVAEAKDSIKSALGNDFGGRVAAMWNDDVEASHGAYRIEPGEKAWRIARKIGQGRQTPVKVTFNNIRTPDRLAERLASRMDFTPEQFSRACSEAAAADSLTPEQFAVQFLPDTYEAYWSASPAELIAKIRQHYTRFWTAQRKEKAAALGLDPMQVSVLASIVEEESNRRDERPKIARLYLNRLKRGMMLQADPTVKFATGDFEARRITGNMLQTDSPYNTYRYAGLPPGIIRYPEASTIDAVLNAPAHDWIYMCARTDGSGYHDFTSSYSTHLDNARKFRAAAYGNAARK